MSKLYYTAPSDEIFAEMKEKAQEVWREVASNDDYLQEKLKEIDIENHESNFMFIFNKFDPKNQKKLFGKLSKEAAEELLSRFTYI